MQNLKEVLEVFLIAVPVVGGSFFMLCKIYKDERKSRVLYEDALTALTTLAELGQELIARELLKEVVK